MVATPHYVYIVGFTDGTVKVGTSHQPTERIKQLGAQRFHTSVHGSWISPCLANGLEGERKALAVMGTPVIGRETFRADYGATVSAVTDAIAPCPRADPDEIARRHAEVMAWGMPSHMIMPCPDACTFDRDEMAELSRARLSRSEWVALIKVATHRDEQRRAWVSVRDVAEFTGLTSSAVSRALISLRDMGRLVALGDGWHHVPYQAGITPAAVHAR